jgi:hypothetical protein
MTFHQLYTACLSRELKARIHQFDCGERVTITNGVGELFSVSKECGEEPNAIDVAGSWLISNGYIRHRDIPAAKAAQD